jgi:hypothetical protein
MAERIDNLDEYIDLTDPIIDLAEYKIVVHAFNCQLIGPEGVVYKGFLLAKSGGGNAYTIVDTDFQWSNKDKKFPVRITFRRTNSRLEDKPINRGYRVQRISLEDGSEGYREFWKMISFLTRFEEVVDAAKLFDSFQLVSKESVGKSLKTKEIGQQKQELIDYILASDVTLDDMANVITHRTRIADLEEFKKLLDNKNNYIDGYRELHSSDIKGVGIESIWHHFLSNHKWIFGLGLDLQFMHDFVDEAAVGNPDTSNTGNPNVDMLGWRDYTSLVEIKTPEVKFFSDKKKSTSRANTWSFSDDFIDGISQVLAQKDDWLSEHKGKTVTHEEDGKKVVLDTVAIRTVDPKTVFIYGNKSLELPVSSRDTEILTKRDTLERFSRNNRNINIISFDELYMRAYHTVHGTLPPPEEEEEDEDDDDWF